MSKRTFVGKKKSSPVSGKFIAAPLVGGFIGQAHDVAVPKNPSAAPRTGGGTNFTDKISTISNTGSAGPAPVTKNAPSSAPLGKSATPVGAPAKKKKLPPWLMPKTRA